MISLLAVLGLITAQPVVGPGVFDLPLPEGTTIQEECRLGGLDNTSLPPEVLANGTCLDVPAGRQFEAVFTTVRQHLTQSGWEELRTLSRERYFSRHWPEAGCDRRLVMVGFPRHDADEDTDFSAVPFVLLLLLLPNPECNPE